MTIENIKPTEQDFRNISTTEFITREINAHHPLVEVEESRIEHVPGENFVLIDRTDGTYYSDRTLKNLETTLKMSVICVTPEPPAGLGKDPRGTAFLNDLQAETIVSAKLYSNARDPWILATVIARRNTRYSGVNRTMLEQQLEVFNILDSETRHCEIIEATLADYLTNPNLHTSDSLLGVMGARSYLGPENIGSKTRTANRQKIIESGFGIPEYSESRIKKDPVRYIMPNTTVLIRAK